MRMIRPVLVVRSLLATVTLAIVGLSVPATAQPLPFDWGRTAGTQWGGGRESAAGGGRIAATGVLLVRLDVEQGCTIAILDGVAQPPSCGGPIPWMANLVSDDDPDFSETVAFGTDAVPAAKQTLARLTAMRFTVDY